MNESTIWDLLGRYLQYVQVIRNYTDLTCKGYEATFKLFLRETEIVYISEFTKSVTEKWFFNGRLERKWSPATFRHYHKRLNQFMKWAVKEGIAEENFLLDIEKPKLEYRIPKTLSKDEAQLVLDASYHMRYTYTFEKYRNRAIVGIMLLAGLRRGEVMKLMVNDVCLNERSLFVRQGKGHKDRIVPMNSNLSSILSRYLVDRKRLKKESLFFFVSAQSDLPIGAKCIAQLMFKLRKKTKLDFSAHTLRHAFARLMLEGGCDIYTLSKIMGHAKITTTTIYLTCSNQQMSKGIEMHLLG